MILRAFVSRPGERRTLKDLFGAIILAALIVFGVGAVLLSIMAAIGYTANYLFAPKQAELETAECRTEPMIRTAEDTPTAQELA
jgi:hypothetical protein